MKEQILPKFMKNVATIGDRLEKFGDHAEVVVADGADWLLHHCGVGSGGRRGRCGGHHGCIGVWFGHGDLAPFILSLSRSRVKIGEELFGKEWSVIDF